MNIELYRFGEIVIDGRRYTRDLKVIRGRVVPDWWRAEGHVLGLSDLGDVIAARPHILVVGTGASGRMRFDPGLTGKLGDMGIRVETMPTGRAVARFSECIVDFGLEAVAAAFHLTC